ncbi:MAG: hypothetical protein KKF44_08565 [Nanoarchaeota archaeon]|nr:hypothetical protein [Nanoarchaeota archaeon]
MRHKILKNRLRKKGWKEHDISRTFATFLEAEEKKHPLIKKLDMNIMWIALCLIVLINLILCFSMIPAYLVLPTGYVILCLILVGAGFGFLADLVIREIEHYSHHHYVLAGIIVPISSLIAIYYALKLSNILSAHLNTSIAHDVFLLTVVYFTSFSLPHLINKHKEITENYSE